MKIAVTYDNGEVFQHFGRTENFMIYEAENGAIVSSKLFNSNGVGHEALAGLLKEAAIDVLICGGMGQGAANALAEAGIDVVAGASGAADAAAEAYLRGELVSSGVNCDHHDHEEAEEAEGCGGGCGNCGGGCGGCGGGCHGPIMEGKNVGKTCRTHYRGTLNDGTQFDSSYDRNEPLEFVCGMGMMIYGFDKAVADMEVGEVKDVHLTPEEAYGPVDPNAIITVRIQDMPGAEDAEVGMQVYLTNTYGQPFPAKVSAKDAETITFDMNHELAGQELNFRIELVEVKD